MQRNIEFQQAKKKIKKKKENEEDIQKSIIRKPKQPSLKQQHEKILAKNLERLNTSKQTNKQT